MKPKRMFENVRVPQPPAELRETTLRKARLRSSTDSVLSLSERLWGGRMLRYAWVASVAALFLFLAFWNPPFPGMTTPAAPEIKQITKADQIEMNLPGTDLRERYTTTQLKDPAAAQILAGEDL
jgi:hypothetical protein